MSHDPMNEDSLREFIGPEHVHGPWIVIAWEYLGKGSGDNFVDVGPQDHANYKRAVQVACSSCLEHKGLASARPDVRTETK